MRIGSLCTGYGGLEMGVRAAIGGTVAWHVEKDPDAAKILAHHWPGVPNHHDVTTADWSQVEPVDVVTAGYPCQPFSHAGKRKGTTDDRHLWPSVAGAISALRPSLVVLENVRGHVSLGLDAVIGDLSGLGYDTQWRIVRASDVGAPHGRARIFIVAYPEGDRWGQGQSDARRTTAGGRTRAESRSRHDLGAARDATRPAWGGPEQQHLSQVAGSAAEPGEPVGPPATNTRGGSLAGAGATRDGLRVATERGHLPATDTQDDRHESLIPGRSEPSLTEPARDRRAATAVRRWEPGATTHPDLSGSGHIGADSCGRESDSRRSDPGRAGQGHREASDGGETAWGIYEPAIRRWEHTLGRVAPAPTEAGAKGQPRLSPRFVEWMQGLPAGHVTDVPDLSRNAQLKALGNGVVPQQAALAVALLLEVDIPALAVVTA